MSLNHVCSYVLSELAGVGHECGWFWVQIAPTKVRGSLGSINQLVICIGIVAALVVNVVIPATSWRTMFYLASIPPILLAVGGWTRLLG